MRALGQNLGGMMHVHASCTLKQCFGVGVESPSLLVRGCVCVCDVCVCVCVCVCAHVCVCGCVCVCGVCVSL